MGEVAAVRWVELLSSNREGIQAIGQELAIHPLALEDCYHSNQRAKFDDFENHQLLVWFAYISQETYELEFVIFPNAIVLVSNLSAPGGLSWFDYLKLPRDARDGYHLLYQALDRTMDLSADHVRPLFAGIDEFEDQLLKKRVDPKILLSLKRQLADAEYALAPLGSVVGSMQEFLAPKDDLRWRLRDLFDHAERVHQDLAFHRLQIASAMDMYWGMTSERVNDRIKKLTLVASISVPLTFWTSFWGMNFESIPYKSHDLFIGAMVVMFASALSIYWVLRTKGYWDRE